MMTINFNCSCGKLLQIDEKHAGKKVRCPACASIISAPSSAETSVQEVIRLPKPPPLPALYESESSTQSATDYEEVEPTEPGDDHRSRRIAKRARVPTVDDIPNHNGAELAEDALFFAPPPKEIGRLLSGYTSFREGREPISSGARAAWVIGSTAVCFLIGLALMAIDRAFFLLAPVAGLAGFLISFLVTRFSPTCTYVGQEGVARLKGDRKLKVLDENVFLFDEAEELRTQQTRHYVNGIYNGTRYAFNWTDADNRRVYSIGGTYHSEAGTPKASDQYYFALAAELAWSEYLLERFRTKLADGGSIKFALRGNDWVRIGPGLLVLNRRGDKIDFEGDDIARVRISQGVVAILEPGAKEGWFSSKGVYKFNYQDLANAQFFLFLMERLLGVRAG